jgi:ferredoxin
VVRISKDKCTGCLICVAECSRGFMRYHDDEPVPFKCAACGLCAKQCPSGALVLAE